mmetsp:Transcript_16285/g.48825  ORF Transcript_16285/g.48825 Transcript_16285/m.48825 type:complete len:203 (-) Transcript_16285:349-957(-)
MSSGSELIPKADIPSRPLWMLLCWFCSGCCRAGSFWSPNDDVLVSPADGFACDMLTAVSVPAFWAVSMLWGPLSSASVQSCRAASRSSDKDASVGCPCAGEERRAKAARAAEEACRAAPPADARAAARAAGWWGGRGPQPRSSTAAHSNTASSPAALSETMPSPLPAAKARQLPCSAGVAISAAAPSCCGDVAGTQAPSHCR